jgi:hypothetical protein
MRRREWLLDTAERAFFTFVEAFLGLLLVSQTDIIDGFSASVLQTALASGLVSALAVVKGAVASRSPGISPASFVADGGLGTEVE